MAKTSAETVEQVIERLHREACEKGRKAYRDPITKVRVCTAEFLLSRGICCNCECRHCPFLSPVDAQQNQDAATSGRT
jgi:hypothetical protein